VALAPAADLAWGSTSRARDLAWTRAQLPMGYPSGLEPRLGEIGLTAGGAAMPRPLASARRPSRSEGAPPAALEPTHGGRHRGQMRRHRPHGAYSVELPGSRVGTGPANREACIITSWHAHTDGSGPCTKRRLPPCCEVCCAARFLTPRLRC
jgi:hypothetical protein